MAINVNTVYQTVLLILNKEQRGYITPDEFNKTATQVQLDIFEQYFDDLNQQLRVPQADVLVIYHFDANAIILQPLKNREADTVSEAWKMAHSRIKTNNLPPKHFIMDNETSVLSTRDS